jgi:hypothetical protein
MTHWLHLLGYNPTSTLPPMTRGIPRMWGSLALWVQEAYQRFFCELHHLGEQEHLLEPIRLVFGPCLLYSGILDAISLLLLLMCGCRLRLSLSVADIEYHYPHSSAIPIYGGFELTIPLKESGRFHRVLFTTSKSPAIASSPYGTVVHWEIHMTIGPPLRL